MESLFTTESLDDFKTVTQEIFNSLCGNEKSSTFKESNVIRAAKEEIKHVIINRNFDLDAVATMVKTKAWDKDKIEHFITMLQERRIALLYSLLAHGSSIHGESLTSFNWVLKIVLGSSELKSLKYPLMQLKLHTETSRDKDLKIYELNKEALNKFINVLENIE